MIDAARFAQVLQGLRLLLTLEPGGLSYFEKTYTGFIRSFFPALVLAPFQAVHVAALYQAAAPTPDFTVTIIVESLAYVVTWTLFPFVMIYVARAMKKEADYFTYMVPYNWLQLLLGLVIWPLTLLVDVGILGSDGAEFFNLLLLGLLLFYGTYLARTAFEISTSLAFGIVVMDIVISLISNDVIDKIPR